MTRVCCVVQCGTKSSSQEKENRKSLFQVNSESENYYLVLNAVGGKLRKSKTPPKRIFICELHFANECIIRTDTEIMRDGSHVLVPRKRPRLKENSIPTIFLNQTQNQGRKSLAAINKQKKLPSSSSTKNKDCTQGETANIGDQHRFSPDKLVAESQEDSQKDIEPTIDRQEKYMVSLFDTFPKSRKTYTQEDLIEDWRAVIENGKTPCHWALCNSWQKIFFVYFGDDYKSTTRTILVKEDMSLEIRYHGRLANLPLLEKLRNFEDFFRVLITVSSNRICEGVDNIPCKDVCFVPKSRSNSNKCTACQKMNKTMKNIARKREKRALLKQKKNESLLANLKRKYERAVRKISKQAAEVEQLMQKSSITGHATLENVIKNMPKICRKLLKLVTLTHRQRIREESATLTSGFWSACCYGSKVVKHISTSKTTSC